MDNSRACKVVGHGTVQIHSHDSNITTLPVVQHIPNSKFNLIYLATLDLEGFVCKTKRWLCGSFQRYPYQVQGQIGWQLYVSQSSDVICQVS